LEGGSKSLRDGVQDGTSMVLHELSSLIDPVNKIQNSIDVNLRWVTKSVIDTMMPNFEEFGGRTVSPEAGFSIADSWSRTALNTLLRTNLSTSNDGSGLFDTRFITSGTTEQESSSAAEQQLTH
jgi:hypothetical protein